MTRHRKYLLATTVKSFRLSNDIHQKLLYVAKENGVTINELCNTILSQALNIIIQNNNCILFDEIIFNRSTITQDNGSTITGSYGSTIK